MTIDDQPAHVAVVDLDHGQVRRRPSEVLPTSVGRVLCLVRSNGTPARVVTVSGPSAHTDEGVLAVAASTVHPPRRAARDRPALSSEAITIVVPSRRGVDRLRRTLPLLLGLDHPKLFVLVVDNAPADSSTADFVTTLQQRDPRLGYTIAPVPGLSRARNRGLDRATTPLVAFLDDDIEPEPDYLRHLVAPFHDRPDVWCTTGRVLPSRLDTAAERLFERFGGFGAGDDRQEYRYDMYERPSALFPFEPGRFGTGGSLAFRTDRLRALGGFDARLGAGTPARGGEDLDITMRVVRRGGTLVYAPAAVCWHPHHAGYDQLRIQIQDYGAGLSAAFTKLMLRPSTASGVIRRTPAGLARLLSPRSEKNLHRGDGYPRELVRRELRGVATGWIGYLRSLRARPQPVPTVRPVPTVPGRRAQLRGGSGMTVGG